MCKCHGIAALFAVMVALLTGCNAAPGQKDFAAVVVELDPRDLQPNGQYTQTIERRWVSTKLWKFDDNASDQAAPVRTLLVELVSKDTADAEVQTVEIDIAARDLDHRRSRARDSETRVDVSFERPGASFAFTGAAVSEPDVRPVVYAGIIRVAFHDGFVDAARQAQTEARNVDMMTAALQGVDANDLSRFAALELRPTIAQITALVQAGVSPANVQTLHDAGYRFTVRDFIALAEANAPIQHAIALREGGFTYSAGQLIRLHEASVDPMYALGMRDAGFADDVDQLIRMKQAVVTPQFAGRMRRLGTAHTDGDVIRLFEQDISPETVAVFQEAGYVLSVDQLILMKNSNVVAEDARKLRRAGYNFSVDDLVKLAQWSVPVEFTMALMTEAYEPLSAEQIVDLHLRRVTVDMIQVLRRERYKPTAVDQ